MRSCIQRRRLSWLMPLLLYCGCLPAFAQTTDGNNLSWLCWMNSNNPPVIRCLLEIADQPVPLTLEEADAGEILELLNTRFYEGATTDELERLYQLYSSSTVDNEILTIPLHTIPYQSSWREHRPQQLLRALMCDKDSPCNITLRKPSS
jgi:hypothetical protein